MKRFNFYKFFSISIIGTLLAPSAFAAVLTQDFLSQQPLVPGTVVSLTKDASLVSAANHSTRDTLYGVVTATQGSGGSSGSASDHVKVATSGLADAFVSNANGDIRVGDSITVDRLAGVGEKATVSQRVVGVAQASLDSTSKGVKIQTVTDVKGKKHKVAIGKIPILLNVGFYSKPSPPGKAAGATSVIPGGVQVVANNVAGRAVSAPILITSLFIIVLAFGIAGVMLYGATSGSMTSLGRNPLASQGVYRGLLGIVGISVITIIAGVSLAFAAVRYL